MLENAINKTKRKVAEGGLYRKGSTKEATFKSFRTALTDRNQRTALSENKEDWHTKTNPEVPLNVFF